MDSGLVTKQEFAVFFEKLGSLKRGDSYRKTKDGLYMIPTGENGVENTIIVTNGDYVNPSIEGIVKINLDNENDIYKVREAYYESRTGMRSSLGETVGSYREEGLFTEYNRDDISMFEDLSSTDGRENSKDVGVYGNNTGKRNGKRSFGKDKSFSFNQINDEEQAGNGLFFNAKNQQLDIIKNSNPPNDDYHTWIRSVDDILTLEEAINESDWEEYAEYNPDYAKKIAEKK